MARRMSFALALSLVATLAFGCAEHAPPPETPAKKPAQAKPAEPPKSAQAAPGHLARPEVERVLRQGPPWLLQRVVPEEVIREGRFVGWRILSLPADWQIDLHEGDVVTKVNGLGIERPDDLWAAWVQMQSAVELRVTYEREGKVRELVMPIDGASGAAGAALETAVEPPPKPRSRWSTVVIGSDDDVPVEPVSE